jgi:hypothetical protein
MNEATQTCSHCGAALRPEMRYCESCGQPVDAVQQPVSESTVPPVLETPQTVTPPPPPTQTASVPPTPPPPPTYTTPAYTPPPSQPKKKFPVWAIILIVLVVLCLCGFLVAGGLYLVGKNAMPAIEDAVSTASQDIPDMDSALQTLTAIPEMFETTMPDDFNFEATPESLDNGTASSGYSYLDDSSLYDDFSTQDLGWAVYDDTVGDQGYENGEYYIHVTESAYVIWSYLPGDFYPDTIEFDARLADGYEANGTLGVMCNYQDENTYTYVDIDVYNGEVQFGYSTDSDLVPMTDESWITVNSFNPNVTDYNHYKVTCDPSTMSLEVNGVLVDSVPVTTNIDAGDMALYGFTWDEIDSNGLKAYFDNVSASGY